MTSRLEDMRNAFDKAQADAESDGAAPEGLSTIIAERIRFEYEESQARVIAENLPTLPEAA